MDRPGRRATLGLHPPDRPMRALSLAVLFTLAAAPAARAQTSADSTTARPPARPAAGPVVRPAAPAAERPPAERPPAERAPAVRPRPVPPVQARRMPPATASPARIGPRRASGPRLGVTYLSPGVVRRINEAETDGPGQSTDSPRIDPSFPVVTQFGWQFEFETFQTTGGATGVAEIVPLLAGLERGIIAPSITLITGLRTSHGFEVGVGPNVAVSARNVVEAAVGGYPARVADVRVGLAFVAGAAARYEGVTLPINAAVVLGAGGARVSLLLGLNATDRRY